MSEIELERRAGRIKILLMDCDGVLTDGRITLLDDGDELKSFHTRDGHGLVLLHRAGLKSGIISGRTAKAVERRARDLGVSFVYQGILDKIATFNELTSSEALDNGEIAYIGDDVTDIPLMNHVGLAVAVADAVAETKAASHYTTKVAGGFGAVREADELTWK